VTSLPFSRRTSRCPQRHYDPAAPPTPSIRGPARLMPPAGRLKPPGSNSCRCARTARVSVSSAPVKVCRRTIREPAAAWPVDAAFRLPAARRCPPAETLAYGRCGGPRAVPASNGAHTRHGSTINGSAQATGRGDPPAAYAMHDFTLPKTPERAILEPTTTGNPGKCRLNR
jgi:hypothetical protein